MCIIIKIQVMMNAMNVPSKRSTLEKKLDKVIATLFGVLLSMCLIGAVGRWLDIMFIITKLPFHFDVTIIQSLKFCSATFVNVRYYYLQLGIDEESQQFNPGNRLLVFILSIFTLITLYSPIIPISLYVSIEVGLWMSFDI